MQRRHLAPIVLAAGLLLTACGAESPTADGPVAPAASAPAATPSETPAPPTETPEPSPEPAPEPTPEPTPADTAPPSTDASKTPASPAPSTSGEKAKEGSAPDPADDDPADSGSTSNASTVARTTLTIGGFTITGVQKTAYTKAGGKKVLGRPTSNAKCGLPGGGCLQYFQKGTVYTQGKRYGHAKATGIAGEMIAAERSRIGYLESYRSGQPHRTWLNTWMNSTAEWCSFLQSWASWATGNGTTVPKSTNWGKFRKAATAKLKRGSKPKVGALAMYDFKPDGVPDHVGLVTSVSGSRIRTIEGNTTGGGILPAGKRGIVEVWRSKSTVAYYLYPAG